MLLLNSITVLLTIYAVVTVGAPITDSHTSCKTSPAFVGGTGTMTFPFRKQLNMSSDKFFAYVVRAGETGDVVRCDRRNEAGITCDVINKAFNPTRIVNHSLTLTAPNVTSDLAGTYTMWTLVDGSQEPAVQCNFTVMNRTGDGPAESAGLNMVPVFVPLAFVLTAAAIVAILIGVFWRKRRRADSGASPMLSSDQVDTLPSDVAKKRWYFGQISDKKEAELVKFRRNGPGSFLIRKCNTSPNFLILAVCAEDHEIKHFRIKQTKNGFQIQETPKNFSNLPKLVKYYRKNDLVVEGNAFGKLKKPFEVHPKEEWYAGRLADREHEMPLFESKGMEEDSFLIRDSITHPECYTLAVVKGGDIKHYRIRVEEDRFYFCDAKTGFTSLSELVRHYQENDIIIRADVEHNTKKLTKEQNLGKLGNPVPNVEGRDRKTSTLHEESGVLDGQPVQA